MYFNRWRKVYQPILIAFRFPILILREFSLPSIIHLVVYNVQDQQICRNDYIYFERLVISCLGFGLLVSTRIDGCNHLKFPSESYIRGFFVLDLKIGIFISQIISQCVQCRWRIFSFECKNNAKYLVIISYYLPPSHFPRNANVFRSFCSFAFINVAQ